ncbi:MAG: B12-binding domain-containing radical SAM protein [Bacteroidia bacterium]
MVLLFNPRSANAKYRIPNSILQVAAAIEGKYEYILVDGNLETDPWEKIRQYLLTGKVRYFGCTCMPGPQLRQAIPITQKIRAEFPHIINIWGGYFASNQYKTVITSGVVDFIIDGPGDYAFPNLLELLEKEYQGNSQSITTFCQENAALFMMENLIYLKSGEIIKTKKAPIPDYNVLPQLPYEKLHQFYPLEKYLGKTYLGKKTIAYHSSFGCPFTCSFCAVVPIYNARWKGKSAELIYQDIRYLKEKYGADGIEFHDNNFFVSEKRTVAFAELVKNDNMTWWGEARIDTMDKYSDASLAKIREAGCKMIFFGAETGNDEVLKKMDKGGTQTGAQILSFAERLKKFDIIPEYSFVLGLPAETEEQVMVQINADIAFIKQVKLANPATEIIIYLYSPVPTEGSELYEAVKDSGFLFPQTLADWLDPKWENFDLRKNPLTPWLKPYMVDKIKHFETVLNGYYPTVSDIRLSAFQRKMIRAMSTLRYKNDIFSYPYELKVLQKLWKYRQPEIEGF